MTELPTTISLDPADPASVAEAIKTIAAHLSAIHSSFNGLCTLIGFTANAAEFGSLRASGSLRTTLLEGAKLCLASTPNAIEALTIALTMPLLTPPPNGGLHLKLVPSPEKVTLASKVA